MNQTELGNAFYRGETSGTASNVQIVDCGDKTALVGYGHAVYATRDKQTGQITEYGWRGYSMSTSCQLTKLGFPPEGDDDRFNVADKHVEERLKLTDVR